MSEIKNVEPKELTNVTVLVKHEGETYSVMIPRGDVERVVLDTIRLATRSHLKLIKLEGVELIYEEDLDGKN